MDRENVTWRGVTLLDLPAQMRNINVHVIDAALIFAPPYIGQDPLERQKLTAVAR